MIKPLWVIVGDARREDFLFPHASRQLESFKLSNCFSQTEFTLKLPVTRQVMVLYEVLPIDFRRHRLNPAPEAFER